MIRLSQENTKQMLAIHGWSGIVLGLLLYAVIATGVAAVFAVEIGAWSSSLPQPRIERLPPGLDTSLRKIAATVDKEFHDDIEVYQTEGGRLRAFFHTHDTDKNGSLTERGVELDIDPISLNVIDRREGFAEEIEAKNHSQALEDFLIKLHVRLHLPNPWGLLLTGILGLAMMVAAVSGFILHRHLLKEIFTLRRQKGALLRARDSHAIAASWNLVFALILAFTGSFFSFAGAFGLQAMAAVAFGGDQTKLIETLIGVPPADNNTPHAGANLDDVINDARRRAGNEIQSFSISHWGRADSIITLNSKARPGELIGGTWEYSGASGEFLKEKPELGREPSLGGTLITLLGLLHFGNFAGPLSKAIWFSLGFEAAYVALSGILLWTTRRSETAAWRAMARATHWVGYGLPLSLTASAIGYFIGMAFQFEAKIFVAGAFLIAAMMSAMLALFINNLELLKRMYLLIIGIILLLLPIMRMLTGGMTWEEAAQFELSTIIAIDSVMFLAALVCLWFSFRKTTSEQLDLAYAKTNV